MLSRWVSVRDREFLFPNRPLVGTLLTAHPLAVFLVLSSSFSALIFLPAWGLDLLSIPAQFPNCPEWQSHVPPGSSVDVGILYKWNWSIGYALVIPLIFALAAMVCRSVLKSLRRLIDDGTVQPDLNDLEGDSSRFVSRIAEGMRPWDRIVFQGSIAIAVLASLWAGHSNLWMYARVLDSPLPLDRWYTECLWDDIDWMHGWTIPNHHGGIWHMLGNLGLYLTAELLQGFVIFLACYFVLNFYTLTQSFANVIIQEGSGFHFEPFVSDPDRCLGLRPIGRIFSIFLLLSIVFQIFAFGLRLQKVLPAQGGSLFAYFSASVSAFKDLTGDPYHIAQGAEKLISLSSFGSLNPGLYAILILMIFPVAVIAWWPVIKLRLYIAGVRNHMLSEFRAEERKARATKQYDASKHIAEDMDKLAKSSIWPNGFKIGWGSFFFLFALLASTVAPPLAVLLVTGGIGLKVLNKIISS